MAQSAPLKLSASALRAYQECKYRYALSYVSPLPHAQRVHIPSLSFGNAIHRTLAQFHRAGGHAHKSKDDLISMLMDHWDSRPYSDPDIELSMFRRAKDLVEQFFDSPYPRQGDQVLGVELDLAWQVPCRQMLAAGRIDLLRMRADGALEVVDYKTSSNPLTPEELASEPQAVIYRSLVASAYPRFRPTGIVVTFHFLGNNTPVSVEFDHEHFLQQWDRIEQICNHLRADLRHVELGARLEDVFFKTISERCKHCPMNHHCSGSPQFHAHGHRIHRQS